MAGRTGSAGEVWSVRGVPADVRQRVAEAASARRMTVGEYVAKALLVALERNVEDVPAESVGAIQKRLEQLEQDVAELKVKRSAAGPARTPEPELDILVGFEDAIPVNSGKRRRRGNPG